MRFDQALKFLSLDYCRDLPLLGDGSGTVPDKNIPLVAMRANLALMSLYTRFPLQKRTVVLETVDGLHTYFLRKEYAQTSGSAQTYKYLKDTVANPFLGDVLMVTDIHDSEHNALPLDDRQAEDGWHTAGYDSLRYDCPRTGERFYVDYRAKHADIPLDAEQAKDFVLNLPASLHTAFLAHIAGNVYAGMGGADALNKSQALLMKYENECQFLEEKNVLHHSESSSNMKPALGGWV